MFSVFKINQAAFYDVKIKTQFSPTNTDIKTAD